MSDRGGEDAVSKIMEFPKATLVLQFCDQTGQGSIDYRHVKTQDQLAAMLGVFASDLIAERYISERDLKMIINTAIVEGKESWKGEKQ